MKWEYLILDAGIEEVYDDELSVLGNDNWELVTVTVSSFDGRNWYKYYFKRPNKSKAKK